MQTTLRIPDELYMKVKKAAKERGITVNAFIVWMLWEYKECLFATREE